MHSILKVLLVFGLLIFHTSNALASLSDESCVNWGLTELKKDTRFLNRPVSIQSDTTIPSESYQIKKLGETIIIKASDPRGVLYALWTLLDFEESQWPQNLQTPYIKLRADNSFLHTNPDNLSDVNYWTTYIDMLARSRFNLIDFHGGYDLETTLFPNLFPLMVHVNEFSKVGDENIQSKNLTAFKKITEHAKNRCIDVGLMNYDAQVEGLSEEENKNYTALAVAKLLKELPNLKYFGFRIGESGAKAKFFEETYLKGIKLSERTDLKLYTRSWQTSRDELVAIANASPAPLFIEIKYNGEQLGLPYQAIHGGGESYSYQKYLSENSPYQIVWQVRANGTHRFLSWADPNFIRRSIKSFVFAGTSGFTLEPMMSYYPTKISDYYESNETQKIWSFIWEKHWAWYFLWGQLSYNPELKNEDFEFQFAKKYHEAGKLILEELIKTGPIIPLSYAYRYQGPDHRNHSPETESGAFWHNHPEHHIFKAGWGQANLLSYGKNTPMDQSTFIGIRDWVETQLGNKKDGRLGPWDMAHLFFKLAKVSATETEIQNPEAKLILKDLWAERFFAEFHGYRILASLYLHWGSLTQDDSVFQKAKALLTKSRQAWLNISKSLDPIYKPLKNKLRVEAPSPDDNQNAFEWHKEFERLEELDQTFEDVWRASIAKFSKREIVQDNPLTNDEKTFLNSLVLAHKNQNKKTVITIETKQTSSAQIKSAWLIYKETPSENHWQKVLMTKNNGSYFYELPESTEGYLYKCELELSSGKQTRLPDFFKERPYRYTKD